MNIRPEAVERTLRQIEEAERGRMSEGKEDSALLVARMLDIKPETVRWLWYPYIALGKLTIIEGDPGLGKSWLTCALASAITHGRGLPNAEPFESGNVLMLSAEDGLADTLRPRLDAVGADVSRVFALAEPLTFDEFGLIRLESSIIEHTPKLVIIDPLFAFTGGKIDIPMPRHSCAVSGHCRAAGVRHACRPALGEVSRRGQCYERWHRLN